MAADPMIDQMLRDPEFQAADRDYQIYLMRQYDSKFAASDRGTQDRLLDGSFKRLEHEQRENEKKAREAAERKAVAEQSWWQKNVAAPTNQLVHIGTGVARGVVNEIGQGTFNPSRVLDTMRRAPSEKPDEMSRFLNPYESPTSAALTLATAGGGKLATAGAKGLARAGVTQPAELLAEKGGVRAATKLAQAGARVIDSTLGGAVGGALDPNNTAAGGALSGLLAGGVGEGASAAAGKIARSIPGAARKIADQDAVRLGSAIEDVSPALKRVHNGGGLYRLAEGGGAKQLSQDFGGMLRGLDADIKKVVPGGKLNIPTLGKTPVTIDEAVDALKKLNRAAKWAGNPSTVNEANQAAARKLKDEIVRALDNVPLSEETMLMGGALADRFKETYKDYRSGSALLKLLQKSGTFKGQPSGGGLNIAALQKALNDPKMSEKLQKLLGPDEFEHLWKAVKRGGPRLGADIPAGGRLEGLLKMGLHGGAGFGLGYLAGGDFKHALIGALAGGVALPNLEARYTGRTPRMSPKAVPVGTGQKLLTLLAGKAVAGEKDSADAGYLSKMLRRGWPLR